MRRNKTYTDRVYRKPRLIELFNRCTIRLIKKSFFLTRFLSVSGEYVFSRHSFSDIFKYDSEDNFRQIKVNKQNRRFYGTI